MAFTLISIAIELAVLSLIYRILLFTAVKRSIDQVFQKQTWWDYLTTYEGIINKDTQVEIVYVALLTIHHFIGGFMMVYAVFYQNPTIWGHAALWELVHDINDIMAMTLLWWPFKELDLKTFSVTAFHHIFGWIIIIPILTTELYLDHDLQFIGVALLFAGAVSCLGLVMSRTMDRRVAKEAWMDFFIWLVNLSVFTTCRFYFFPMHLYRFFVTTN